MKNILSIFNYPSIKVLLVIILVFILSACELLEFDKEISAAVKVGDPEICAKLEDDPVGRIDRCFDRVAQKVKDPAICDRIGGDFRKDDCFSDLAVRIKDGELCNRIVNKDEKNDCLFGVSKRTNDIKLCNKIDSLESTQKNQCLTNIAINKNDINICLNLKNIENKNDCVSQLAIRERDFSICDKITDLSKKTVCQMNIAINSRKKENCEKITNEDSRQMCIEQIGTTNEPKICSNELSCSNNEICIDSKCVIPECTKEVQYCRGDKLEICQDKKLSVSTCIYGCQEDKCLKKEEKDEIDKQKAEENSCEENYNKCISDTTLEFCSSKIKTEKLCKFGCKSGKCEEEAKIDISKTIGDMKEKQSFGEVVSGPYMKTLELAIGKERNSSKKGGLEAFKSFLGKSADTYGSAIATLEDLEKLKKIFMDEYDPSMDIENMKASDILDKGLTERLTDAISGLWPFGNKKGIEQLEQDQAEEQLKVYEAMLERKKEIEFLKKSRLDRLGNTMVNIVTERIASTVKDKAKDMAETAGGTAFATVGILSEAIETVQNEAQNMMFTGLIKAYNRRRNVLENEYPLKSKIEIHELAVTQIEKFPYADAKTGVLIAKYGNLLANKDCIEEGNTNPLCLDRHAFWVSMQKSYEEVNDKKMFDRWLNQMKSEE